MVSATPGERPFLTPVGEGIQIAHQSPSFHNMFPSKTDLPRVSKMALL